MRHLLPPHPLLALLALPGPINTFREMSPPPHPLGSSSQDGHCLLTHPGEPPTPPTSSFVRQLLNMFISILMKRPDWSPSSGQHPSVSRIITLHCTPPTLLHLHFRILQESYIQSLS
ncbi:hypothetical protein J6590_057930 [Homalodisca vitripennis]|nr:hypothetical protein J6590_057930 [Homalodisca vitripennis]